MGLKARGSYRPSPSFWSGVNGEKHPVEGYSISSASILMIFACQCFLFEEQFNKQSLAFHVEGKICNGIHLPGSSSLGCDWIKPFAKNTGEVLVAPSAPWVPSLTAPPPPCTGWKRVGGGDEGRFSGWLWTLLKFLLLEKRFLRKSNLSLELHWGPWTGGPRGQGAHKVLERGSHPGPTWGEKELCSQGFS